MSATRTRSGSSARTTRRERAEQQSLAARARQQAPRGGIAHALRSVRLPDPDTRGVVEPARWRTYAALGLALVGLGVSCYLTVAHFSGASLVCSGSGLVNCEKVTTSAQSYFLGVPVALWGLIFFVAMTAVNLPVAWRSADRRLHGLRLAMGAGGICFVLYLVSAEFLIIKNICLWCTGVHVVTFLLFVLLMITVPQMLGWGTRSAHDWTG
ncbi:MAG TPA: vitamin K epoxide reductase family protein [Acidimicrobiales bacterium]|nr:vitamin K epoxide reductase family protein [Acidimicrobiales bacterium]